MKFWDLLQISGPVYVLLVAGFITRKCGALDEVADKSLLRLVLNLFLPCLILDLTIDNEALQDPKNFLYPPLFGFFSILAGFGVSWLVGRVGKMQGAALRTFVFSCGIQNYGYVALPITLALFGRDAAAVLFGYSLGVEVAFWGVGIVVLSGHTGKKVFAGMLTPPLVSIVAGIFLNWLGVAAWVPVWADRSLGMLGACAIPCALLLTGALFADYSQPQMVVNGKRVAFFGVVARVVLMPCILLAAAYWIPMDELMRAVLLVQAAMPTAVAPMAIARMYGGDMPVAFKVILTTNLLGLVTVPLWLAAGAWLLKIGG